jgi:perosamine synthetase
VMTSAEGGMIVTNDDRLNQEARIYRDQGKEGFLSNFHIRMGHNWRMSEPHAIIGVKHLERLPDMIADRQRIAALYDEALVDVRRVKPLRISPDGQCCFYKYVTTVDGLSDRKALKKKLREEYAIGLSGEVYEDPCHKQPVFERWAKRALPVAETLLPQHICLPVYSGMTDEDALRVVAALREVLA